MDRLVVLVDAGYLLSQAVQILSSKKSRSRADLKLTSASGLVKMLIDKAKLSLDNDKLLRVYWYDGVKGSLSADHKAICDVDDVQLRMGTVNGNGQQKGVDSKIVIDLIELASNQAISDALVITGDGDLAVGIELSQRRGIRVAVLGVEEVGIGVMHSQSAEVTNVADRVIRVGLADLTPYLAYIPKTVATTSSALPSTATVTPPVVPAPVPSSPSSSVNTTGVASTATIPTTSTPLSQPASSAGTAPIFKIVSAFVSSQNPPLSPTVIDAKGQIEKTVDRALLFYVFNALSKRALSPIEKGHARQALRLQLRACP